MPQSEFVIVGTLIAAGSRAEVEIPVSLTSDHTPVGLSVEVIHGEKPGPVVFVSAAVHGNEVIGIEIVRRLLRSAQLRRINGTLLVVPIVNQLAVMNRSRYLPDRRDLNRHFPGNELGSLASRLANIFCTHVMNVSDVGIDLHSAAIHRSNLAQIRIAPDEPRLLELAEVFGAPVVMTSKPRAGSLRGAALDSPAQVLLFEAGQALRFDESAVRAGVAGILRLLDHLGMTSGKKVVSPKVRPVYSHSSYWVRAPVGGLLRAYRTIGDQVTVETKLGQIADPFGKIETPIFPASNGLIIGRTELPLINEGDALFHIARLDGNEDAGETVDVLNEQLDSSSLFDEDEII